MNISFNPVPKPNHGRNKPTAKMRGSISPSVRKALHARSNGVCERCHKVPAAHAAHLVRRWLISERTTVTDLCHLCLRCHINADTSAEGRAWLDSFRTKLEELTCR